MLVVNKMKNIHIRRFWYHVKHRYVTMNNLVVLIAGFIAVSWAWASVGVVQRNYSLQREVDDKHRQQQLIELQTENLAYEQRYYKSTEYQALEVRKRLGLGDKGEKVLILPPNSSVAKVDQSAPETPTPTVAAEPSNLQQWLNFLFGGNNNRP